MEDAPKSDRKTAPTSLTEPPAPPPAIAIMKDFCDQVVSGRENTLTSDDPEGPHGLRVGLRRLRSGLYFFRSVLDKNLVHELSDEARWLGQEVGHLRDLDVLWRDTIAPLAAEKTKDKGLAALDQLFCGATLRMQVAVRKTLCGPRVGRFVEDLSQLSDRAHWSLPDENAKSLVPLSQSVLKKRLKRAQVLGEHFDTLSIDDRHEFRKDLKKLRYSLEIAHSLHGRKETSKFIKTLKKLQDRLGLMNDAAVAKEVLTDATADLVEDDPARIAAMNLIAERNSKAKVDARKVRDGWNTIATGAML